MRARFNSISNAQCGSITVFFCLIGVVILSFIGYSFYIGQSVNQKIKITNAADLGALSMSQHAATGLNMISGNNLAIAAHLHTAAATVFIGRYWAIIQAFFYHPQESKTLEDAVKSESSFDLAAADQTSYAKAFGILKSLPGIMVSTAAGLTSSNKFLKDVWLLEIPLVGATYVKANAPMAAAFPLQVSSIRSRPLLKPKFIFQFDKLKTLSSHNTFCHSISSSKSIDERDRAAFWLNGLSKSFGLNLSLIAGFENAARTILEIFTGAAKSKMRETFKKIKEKTGGTCTDLGDFGISTDRHGNIRKSRERTEMEKACGKLDEADSQLDKIGPLPLPSFTNCGIADGGDFGTQSQNFSDSIHKKDDIGFLTPDIKTKEEYNDYLNSLTFGIVAASNVLHNNEYSKQAGANQCPRDMEATAASGQKYCLVELENQLPHGFNHSGSFLANVPMATSLAKVIYFPSSGDPTAAQTYNLNPNAMPFESFVLRTKSQMFWPAWRARLTNTDLDKEVMSQFGKKK